MKTEKTIQTNFVANTAATTPLHVDAASAGKKHFAPAELKMLVLAAQAHDQAAIDTLCEAFRPLIMKEAHISYVQNKLGEDAENTAWEIFLGFILGYQGKKYRLLPGLIQAHLHYGLLHKAYPQVKTSVEDQLLLDFNENDEHSLQNIPVYDSIPLEENLCEYNIEQLLQCLTAKQREVIEVTILGNKTLDEFRLEKNVTFVTAYKHQQRGLQRLRKAIKLFKQNNK